MPLRNLVIFPGMVQSLAVGRAKSLELTQQAAKTDENIFFVSAQKDTADEDPRFNATYRTGCIVRILKLTKMPDGTQTTVIQGISRARVRKLVSDSPYFTVEVTPLADKMEPGKELDALVVTARQLMSKLIAMSPQIPDEAALVVNNLEEPGQIADFVIANLNYNADRKQPFLEELNVRRRLKKTTELLSHEIELLELAGRIQDNVKTSMDKTQREYYLREQLKAIQQELGIQDERGQILDELRRRLDGANLPPEVAQETDRELQRLEAMSLQSPEFHVGRGYLEYLGDLPWARSTRGPVEIDKARRILDADHYGLEKIKQRILEFLAVRKLRQDARGPILCFVGPPGVGKTSLGQSIARATGRRFVRMSLGGLHDEAEIRGHRRTYVGAMPGRIIQEMRKVGANDPVFMLDEVDKVGADWRGNPTSALLEVLDPEQNATFTDNYLGVPFDLSKTMFVTTANVIDTVPAPLRDRMEVIALPGYTENEKLQIARRYLVPRNLESHGLKKSQLRINASGLREIIRHYTREAGVRNLEREISAVCRGVARRIAEGKDAVPKISIKEPDVEEYLGPARFLPDVAERTSVPGVATGLGWTPVGGDILFIESTSMQGTGKLILTGQLGDVMRESAQAALSYIRSKASDLAVEPQVLRGKDIHVHVPAGAIPKDGPSAGVTIFTSMFSLVSGRPVRSNVAMTGEITLRGMVLPVGGIKEKVLAASQAGIRTVILPERNAKDLGDIPPEIRKKTTFHFVKRMEEVLPLALADQSRGRKSSSRRHKAARKKSTRNKAKERAARGADR